jgi:hypothetical protein
VSVEPSSCRHCGIPEREHMQRWITGIGWHQWTQPTDDQRLTRMKNRRSEGETR